MTGHLTPAQLSALADGELAAEELREVKQHIDTCLPCATGAIDELQLKAAVAQAGRRSEAPAEFRNRMAALIAQENRAQESRAQESHPQKMQPRETPEPATRGATTVQTTRRTSRKWPAYVGWASAAVVLLAIGGLAGSLYQARNSAAAGRAVLVAEACDLHIATLAANQPPQVISSDRHTVKPWFQGKLPFSFNLPDPLPDSATLDGANLVYLGNRPVAQLLFSIGRHRVSVFVEQRSRADVPGASGSWNSAHEGFNVVGFSTAELEMIAISDVDPSRLSDLADSLEAAQH
jgi:anti-sigma factor RsiW